jgi:3-methyladenine DNA glycosylase AlkD
MIDYRSFIAKNSEPEYARFSSKLLPGTDDVRGVRIPKLKTLAKRIVKDGDWRSFLDDDMTCFEERLLHAFVIATAPMTVQERLVLTETFLPYVDNWSVCDGFCQYWTIPPGSEREVWNFFSDQMNTGNPLRMRVSLVARMVHYKDRESTLALMEDILSHDNTEYYYRMGAAWTFSFCFIRERDAALEALESGRMELWTHNKSIQKIRESFRVSPEDKALVNGLKRRKPRD